MSSEQFILDNVEPYLSGEMPGEVKQKFEEILFQNPDLQELVNGYKLSNQLVLENRLMEIKELSQLVHQTQNTFHSWKKFGLIASLLLITGTGAILLLRENKSASLMTEKTNLADKIENQKPDTVAKIYESQIPIQKPKTLAKPNTKTLLISAEKEENVTEIDKSTASIGKPAFTDTLISKPILNKEHQIDPCSVSLISANFHTTPACKGEENGAILISGYKGGKAPYTAIVYDQHKNQVNTAGPVSAGNYSFIVKDARHCTTFYENIVVKEKVCEQIFSINPFIGEVWNIPQYGIKGTLTIIEKTGNVYFSKEIPGGNQEHWSGQSLNGEFKTGFFLFQIHYSDGTSKQGSISIVQ